MVVVHVDDILLAGKKDRCDRLYSDLKLMVPINNLGELSWYTGCSLKRDRSHVLPTISQQAFIEMMLDQFGTHTTSSTPACTSARLNEFNANEPEGDWSFREAVGSLMWVSNQTR